MANHRDNGPKRLIELMKPSTPAEELASLFKGVEIGGKSYRSGYTAISAALESIGQHYDRRSVTRWNWSKKNGGSDGRIPQRAIPHIVTAARLYGIVIPRGFFDPPRRRTSQKPSLPPEAQGLLE
jgi:hypothetical protein